MDDKHNITQNEIDMAQEAARARLRTADKAQQHQADRSRWLRSFVRDIILVLILFGLACAFILAVAVVLPHG